MGDTSHFTLDCIIFGLQRFGGISNYWARLVDHAASDSSRQWHLILPKRITYYDFVIAWKQRLATINEQWPARATRYLNAPVPDRHGIFHTSYYRLPRVRTSRYVVTVYDFTYERYRSGIARRVHTLQKLRSIRSADAVICISEATKNDVQEFCPEIDPSRIYVVHLGVDTDIYFKDASAEDPALEETVLFVGQRNGYKRFDLAIDAIRERPTLKLGIVGPALTSDERTRLRDALGTRWHEFGPVSPVDLRRLYSSSFAFIFPSDYEGFGLPVLEAMACACPVVAASTSSLPEVGGSAALYASEQSGAAYGEALARLESLDARQAAIEAGWARVAEFSWTRTIEQTLSIYQGE